MNDREREQYGRELAKLLDRIDREKEQLADEVKERRGQIAKMEKRARELRDLATGRSSEQLAMVDPASVVLSEARTVAARERKP